MECLSMPWMMIEQAKEELQLLETYHPNRFDYLKLELKSFISLLQTQNLPLLSSMPTSAANSTSVPTSSKVTTQASSTSCKKRKKNICEVKRGKEGNKEAVQRKIQRVQGVEHDECTIRRDRVDAVINKAQACLDKIQKLKTGFLSYEPGL